MLQRNRMLWLWLLGLCLAILTHKIGWDIISTPLTLCLIFAGFIHAVIDFARSRIPRGR